MGEAHRLRLIFAVVGWQVLAIVSSLFLPASAQAPKPKLKPTELVVRRYERIILRGALLTPEGWKLASELFTSADAYPAHGEIQVAWTGTHALGEESNDGSRAQVNTKWNDFYGMIDSKLRFRLDRLAPLPMMESFTLILVPHRSDLGRSVDGLATPRTEWRIEGPLNARAASIPAAIQYLEKMRDQTNDPALRKNAEKSIDALKHLRTSCVIPNPC